MKENARLGPFQTQILECRVKSLIGESAHVMVMPLRAGAAQPGGVWSLPLGLYVLYTYTRLKMSSSKVSMVVRNMSESPIFLKKGVQVARIVSALPVPPAELSLQMEVVLGAEDRWQPLSVAEQQRKLLEKLNLDGLATGLLRMPQQHESFHLLSMMFSHWMGMSLVVPVHLSMRSRSLTVSHSRCSSGRSLHCCWRRCTPHSKMCWMWGHTPQPITMVQCCGTGEEERQDPTVLCRFLQAQHTHQEGFLSTATDTGGIG